MCSSKVAGVLPCCRVTVEQQEPGDRGQTSRHTQERYTAPAQHDGSVHTHILSNPHRQRHTTLAARPLEAGELHSCVCDNRASTVACFHELHTSNAASPDPIRSRIDRLCVPCPRARGRFELVLQCVYCPCCRKGQKLKARLTIMPGTGSRNAQWGRLLACASRHHRSRTHEPLPHPQRGRCPLTIDEIVVCSHPTNSSGSVQAKTQELKSSDPLSSMPSPQRTHQTVTSQRYA